MVALLLEDILLCLRRPRDILLLELNLHLIAEGCHLIEALPDPLPVRLVITLLSLLLILNLVVINVLVVLFLLHNDTLSIGII